MLVETVLQIEPGPLTLEPTGPLDVVHLLDSIERVQPLVGRKLRVEPSEGLEAGVCRDSPLEVVGELIAPDACQPVSVAVDACELPHRLRLEQVVGRDVRRGVVGLALDVRRRVEVDEDRDALVVVDADEPRHKAVRKCPPIDIQPGVRDLDPLLELWPRLSEMGHLLLQDDLVLESHDALPVKGPNGRPGQRCEKQLVLLMLTERGVHVLDEGSVGPDLVDDDRSQCSLRSALLDARGA